MIFPHDTWRLLLEPSSNTGISKTQARQIVKDTHRWVSGGVVTTTVGSTYKLDGMGHRGLFCWHKDHIVYGVDNSYTVQPSFGQPTIWWQEQNYEDTSIPAYRMTADEKVYLPVRYAHTDPSPDEYKNFYDYSGGNALVLDEAGYKPLKITITNILNQDVRNITDEEAKAEGFDSTTTFLTAWVNTHLPHKLTKNSGNNLWSVIEQGELQPLLDNLVTYDNRYFQAWVLKFKVLKG